MITQLDSSGNTIKSYWKDNLSKWEKSRYGKLAFFNPAAHILQKRIRVAASILRTVNGEGFRWIELGCGSGTLRQVLGPDFPGEYQGYDISPWGIEEARRKSGLWPRTEFFNLDITCMEKIPADGLILLGVTDWISREELVRILSKSDSSHLIISFTIHSERVKNRLYRFYHRYFRRTSGNSRYPLSYTEREISSLMDSRGFRLKSQSKHGWGPGRVFHFVRGRSAEFMQKQQRD